MSADVYELHARVIAAEQREWAQALSDAGCESYLWRPADLEQVAAILRRRAVI